MVLLWQAIEDELSRTPKMSQNVNATQGFKASRMTKILRLDQTVVFPFLMAMTRIETLCLAVHYSDCFT